ncbi:endonuclease/exonuclease/phosphatase family protein [soil metagenome]
MTPNLRRLLTAALAMALAASPATAEDDGPTVLKVATFNIRYDNPGDGDNAWPNRKELAADFLRDLDADSVGLQEAISHQLEYLVASSPEYASLGVGRDDGKEAGEFCAIIYRKDRLRPEESGTFWLSDTPEVPGSTSWGNEITRICTWARFTHLPTGATFYHYNTHFDHRSQPSRERSSTLVLERMAARAHPDDPAILTGDFNAAPDNPAIVTLRSKLTDTFRAAHPDAPETGTFTGFNAEPGEHKIDYVFVTPDLGTTAAEIHTDAPGGRPISDHYPVSATVTLPAQ